MFRSSIAFIIALLCVVLTAGTMAFGSTSEKVALVIGNSNYSAVPKLRNPRNDAQDLAASLENIGFEVTTAFDLDQSGLLRGLREFQSKARQAFAAKAGTVAADGTGRNSPYAQALLKTLAEPKVEVGLLFRQVRDRVIEETGGAQEPFFYGSLSSQRLYLNETEEPVEVAAVAVQPIIAPEVTETEAPRGDIETSSETTVVKAPQADEADTPQEDVQVVVITPEVPSTPAIADVSPVEIIEPERASRGEIREIQERLTILELKPGPIDGLPGRRTANAIMEFEKQKDMQAAAAVPTPQNTAQAPSAAELAAQAAAAEAAAKAAEQERRKLRRARLQASDSGSSSSGGNDGGCKGLGC